MDIQELQQIIGAHLRELRGARGWSQQQLAEKARISADFVSQAERGKRAPSVFVITKLSAALGVQPADFLISPSSSAKESEPFRDLRLLLSGRPDNQVRLVWKLAKLVLEEGEQAGTGASTRGRGARSRRRKP